MDQFLQAIEDATKKFSEFKQPIRIISHLDTDGLTSASILIAALKREDIKFSLSIVKQLSPTILKEFSKETYESYIFSDLGSGNLKDIKSNLANRSILILDHHQFEEDSNFIHINPRIYNENYEKEISGAGICYLFAKTLNEKNKDLAHLAIIGAIGDMQENNGFIGYNKEILEDAISQNKIEIKTGLRMFGSQTRPLYKVLQYSTDPYIPEITGNEDASINLLKELNIDKDKKLIHLSEEETKSLVTAIVLKRLGSESNPDDVLGPIYLLKEEKEESPTKDAREFSTLLNSCGRLSKYSLGIGTCLNDKKIKEEAFQHLLIYKKEIINSLNWFYKNKEKIIEQPRLTIINAENNIKDTMIGTLASMISNSNLYPNGTIIISMAHTPDENIKISIRLSGRADIDLKSILNEITSKLGYPSGGHKAAAGSIIPLEKELEFINLAQETITESFIKPNLR